MKSFKYILILLIIISTFCWPNFSYSLDVNNFFANHYPRLANYYLKSPIEESELELLARWDILILGAQVQYTNPEIFSALRELNPEIVILAYVPCAEFPYQRYDALEPSNGFYHQLIAGIDQGWWLYEPDGDYFSWWAGNRSLNVTNQAPVVNNQRWNTYLPNQVNDLLMASNKWDGVFYDNVWNTIDFINGGYVDVNRDGRQDDSDYLAGQWSSGMTTLLSRTRELLGSEKIIMVNGDGEYYQIINGRMYENFPQEIHVGTWSEVLVKRAEIEANAYRPAFNIFNANTQNTGNRAAYQAMRYGLTSALLGGSFYSFDYGDQAHEQLWWYDEYNLVLGPAKSVARNLTGSSDNFPAGLWRRDFLYGLVLVNSTNTSQTVTLEDGFEKIHGIQDVATNNGSLVSTVTVPAQDGLILLRRLQSIEGATYINGSYAKVFDHTGRETRVGFFAYNNDYLGGRNIVVKDIDADSQLETVTAEGSSIVIYNQDGSRRLSFIPYNPAHNVEPNFTLGDLTGDGIDEIVTGTPRGQGPHVLIFSISGRQLNPGFFPYPPQTRGGVHVEVGDLNGDGYAEIVTGAGYGDGPHVRIYSGQGRLLSGGWFAYDYRFRGGVNIAVGDVDADGKAEIVTGSGYGGGPHVRIFNEIGQLESPGFFAYSANQRSGVQVVVSDINHDGQDDILAMTSTVYIVGQPVNY